MKKVINLESIKDRLIDKGFDPESIEVDRQFNTVCLPASQISIWVSNDPYVDDIGAVFYDVDASVDSPNCDTIEALMREFDLAMNHIRAYNEALKQNNGQLPVGWCY